jgi:hypothetical protein
MYYFLDNLDNVKQCIGKTTGLIWNSINFVSMQITGLTFRLPRIADNNFNTQFNILKALFFYSNQRNGKTRHVRREQS